MNKLKSVNDEMDTREILYAKRAPQEVTDADCKHWYHHSIIGILKQSISGNYAIYVKMIDLESNWGILTSVL